MKMAIAMVLYMDRRFRIDKVALEFSGFVSRLLRLSSFRARQSESFVSHKQ